MSLSHYIQQIQKLPYRSRVKILWGTTVSIAIILVLVWVATIKLSIKPINTDALQIKSQQTERYIKVERLELANGTTQIFFSIKNTTDKILSFSRAEDIILNIGDTGLKPTRILTRQNKPFVQKILSNNEEFGILVFGELEPDEATITFSNLYFENTPETVFEEAVEVDLGKLPNEQPIRE